MAGWIGGSGQWLFILNCRGVGIDWLDLEEIARKGSGREQKNKSRFRGSRTTWMVVVLFFVTRRC